MEGTYKTQSSMRNTKQNETFTSNVNDQLFQDFRSRRSESEAQPQERESRLPIDRKKNKIPHNHQISKRRPKEKEEEQDSESDQENEDGDENRWPTIRSSERKVAALTLLKSKHSRKSKITTRNSSSTDTFDSPESFPGNRRNAQEIHQDIHQDIRHSVQDIPSMTSPANMSEVDESLGERVPCPQCGRQFLADRLPIHSRVCKKVFQSKRKGSLERISHSKVFDSTKARAEGTELAAFTSPKSPKSRSRSANPSEPKGKASGPKGNLSEPKGVPRWKQNHEALRAAIRAGKAVNKAIAQGKDLRDVPAAPSLQQTLLPCPYCGRKFSEVAAEKHFQICKNVVNKPRGVKGASKVPAKQTSLRGSEPPKRMTIPKRTELPKRGMDSPKRTTESPKRVAESKRGSVGSGALTPCPHCGRRFEKNAAERHVPICQNVQNKPKRFDSKSSRW